ncbi:MAG TPA: AraC family transcriptional regulator [Mycobacterium sp.]
MLADAAVPVTPLHEAGLDSVGMGAFVLPRTPRSAAAATVARELLRNPALDHTIQQWAARLAVSDRTLLRDFHRDTGLTFSRWRTRCRLTAAREFLSAGYAIGWTATRVGFGSRNGFARAFRTEYGYSPSQYARDHTTCGVSSDRVAATRQHAAFADLTTSSSNDASAWQVPASYTASRVNDFSVLLWAYKGKARARVGEQTFDRTRGEAFWLPAGLANATGSSAGSIDIPIGDILPADAQIGVPLRTRFPPSWDLYLLHCSVTGYTMLRPDNYDHRHILDLFAEQFAAQRAKSVRMPRSPAARAVAMQFMSRLGKPGCGTFAPDISSDTENTFRSETGMSFQQWQHAARMLIARDLLAAGAKSSSIAGRVGYSHVSNFSRAFARFHGMPPRVYQRQETGAL